MSLPRIAVLPAPDRSTPPLLAGEACFVVVEPGVAEGTVWSAGDVVVVEPATRSDDLVVLVARGMGRPRLGTACAGRLFGEAGEACSPVRWRVAGRVRAVWRWSADGTGWGEVASLGRRALPVPAPGRALPNPSAGRPRPVLAPEGQLPLPLAA
jgi:hypothetical protein